jgi:hypothetical protein
MILAFAFFMMAQHSQHVDARHDTFGMSHEVTHHNFRLFSDGGAIELRANDPADGATVAAIRAHLHHIAASLAKNDFSMPLFVHGHEPDGTATMKRLHDRISYRYEDVEAGGRVRVTTADPTALRAVHDFMKFQIKEHRTGDRGEVEVDR